MERFPKMLYRFPAAGGEPVQLQDGIYNALIVDDEAAHDEALAAGWHETPADAKGAEAKAKQAAFEAMLAANEAAQAELAAAGAKAADKSDDGQPATRAELEQKATELGIEFSPKIGDAKLAERIAAKLAEAGA